MATPAVKKNKVTILKGTPNEQSFYFENPSNPTAGDIAKVKEFYGIDQSASPQQLVEQLNQYKTATQANILKIFRLILKLRLNNIIVFSHKKWQTLINV